MAAGDGVMTEDGIAPDRDLESSGGQVDVAAFHAQIDTMFRVKSGSDPIPLRLAEVIEERSAGGIERFSLFFHGPPDRMLPQDTYSFHHDTLGDITIFIVPIVGSNDERIVYEACFNRRLTASARS
jgi:hypothetical protein